MADIPDLMSSMSINNHTTHPWHDFYYDELPKKPKTTSAEFLEKVTLEHIEQFRRMSEKYWLFNQRTTNEYTFAKNKIRSSAQYPYGAFAYFSVIEQQGNWLVLTPVFNETFAHDRLDLRLVRMNANARDTMNEGYFDAKQHPIGEIVCVTKLQRRQSYRFQRIDIYRPEDVATPDGKHFWEVAEYFPVPFYMESKVLTCPYFFDRSRSCFLCVGEGFQEVIEIPNTVGRCVINQLISTTVFTPLIKPGQFLASLKPNNWQFVAKLSPTLTTLNTYSPVVLNFRTASTDIKMLFENFDIAFKVWDRETAYANLKTAVQFGANGNYAIKNRESDPHIYTTRLIKHCHQDPYVYFKFNVIGGNSVPPLHKWNQSSSVVIRAVDSMIDYFFADVLSAQYYGKEMQVHARASTQTFAKSLFDRMCEKEVKVQQRKEIKPRQLQFNFEKGSNADKFIQALYGGVPLPQVTLAPSQPLRAGGLVLLDTQTRYARMVANSQITALIGSSSFGCGKTAAIAAAALHAYNQSPKKIQMVTAVTNSAVVSLIEKLRQIDSNIGIIRIITAQNTTQLPDTQLTDCDYPNVLAKFLKDQVLLEDQDGVYLPEDLLKQSIAYLKSKSLLAETSLTSRRLKLFFEESVHYQDVDLLNFYMTSSKPAIIAGTIQSIISSFSLEWRSSIDNIDTIQIDEASTLPRHTLLQIVSMFPSARYSLVGDYRQLSPYHQSNNTSDLLINTAIGNTLYHCVTKKLFPSVFFNGVFRCRPEITELLGRMFYDSALTSLHQPSSTELQLENSSACRLGRSNKYPIVMVNTDGSKHSIRGTSLLNVDEANSAIDLAKHLLQFVDRKDIAILCFYRAQLAELRDFAANSGVYIGSVDSAQGREWHVCIICTTRTSSFKSCKFLTNSNRVNVAMSRSRNMNFIFGSVTDMYNAQNWKDIVAKCSEERTIVRNDDLEIMTNRSDDADDYHWIVE